MESAVFDTNILIDFSRRNEQAQDVIRRVPHRLISIVTWAEFLTGIPAPQMETAKSFLDDMFEIVETPRAIYERALILRQELRLKLPDALIYATALDIKAPLVTRNIKDFDAALAGVVVPYQ